MPVSTGQPFSEALIRDLSAPIRRTNKEALETRLYPGQLLPYVGFAEAAGIRWESALEAAGLPRQPEDPSLELTSGNLGRFAKEIADLGVEQDLAFLVSRHGAKAGRHPRLESALSSAPTALAALVATRELLPESGPSIQLEFHLTPSHLYVGHVSAGRGESPGAPIVEVARTIALVSLLGRFLGKDWRPHAVGFTSHPSSRTGLSEWLQGGRIVTNLPLCILPVPIVDLQRAAVDRCTSEARETRMAIRPRTALDGAGTLLQLLEAALPSSLTLGAPRVEEAAEMVGLSVRTLQRRLREGGVSYRHLLQRARLREGWRLLVASDDPVRAISRRLGYQEATNFSRTFRRRFGLAPSQARSLARG